MVRRNILNGLRYDGPAVDEFRNTTSPYNGKHKGAWPIRYDPRDLSTVYFQHPDSHEWHEVTWVGSATIGQPFSDLTLRYAKHLVTSRGGESRSRDDLVTVLAEVIQRAELNTPRGRNEQRLAAKASIHTWQLARDRADTATLDQLPELENGDDASDLFNDAFDSDGTPPMKVFDPEEASFVAALPWGEDE